MARPTRLDCSISWVKRKVRGRHVMPRVTLQPVKDYCRAQVAVESFEARARIVNALLDLPFPTLSILHLIDQFRDAEERAPSLVERKMVQECTYAFELLQQVGVVTKETYDAAPEVDGQHTKNVRGQKHYKLAGHRLCPFEKSLEYPYRDDPKGLAHAVDEIDKNGPVFGWFEPFTSFGLTKGEVYTTPKDPKEGNVRQQPHALLLYGMGSRGRRTSAFAHQNSWGRRHHIGGRGLINTREFVHVIVPIVEKNWVDD